MGTGAAGGAATGSSASATDTDLAGGRAYASASSVGGVGGAGTGTGYAGGAGGAVSGSSAYANGYSAEAQVIQTGGSGGKGVTGAAGGAGADSSLDNAVSAVSHGGYIYLSQWANGGAGGYGSAGGGTAGIAASTLNVTDGFTTYLKGRTGANGGAGGGADTGATTAGGSANASNTLAGVNGVYAYAQAGGGAGGAGVATGGAGGGAAYAAATASGGSASAALVSANAHASGGAGGGGSTSGAGGAATAMASASGGAADGAALAQSSATGGSGATLGAANATSQATTLGGAQAQALATANGSSGLADAIATTSDGLIVTSLVSEAQAPTTVDGATAQALANGANPYGFTGAGAAYALGTVDPNAAFLAAAFAANPNVGSKSSQFFITGLGRASSLTFGAATEGMLVPGGASASHDYVSSETFTFNGQDLSGDLLVGLIGSSVTGSTGDTSDFSSLTFTVKVNGVTEVSDTFTSLAAAEAFFSNNVLNLGAVPEMAGDTVQMSLDVTSATAGFGFADQFVVGATDGSPPPVLTAPTSVTVEAGKPKLVSGVSVNEPDPLTGSQTVTVVVLDHSGLLSVTAGQGVIGGQGTTRITLVGTVAQVNADLATLTYVESIASDDTIVISSSDSRTGVATKELKIAVTAPLYFTKKKDHLVGGPNGDIFIATDGTLTKGDTAVGGAGMNTLELQGPGKFDLGSPSELDNIQTVTAQELQPTSSHHGWDNGHDSWDNGDGGWGKGDDDSHDHDSQTQTVILRDGMNGVTVNVAPATLDPHNPARATITVIGADNNDVINLASGDDKVVLGSSAETVHGGSGVDRIYVDGNTIGATIDGGTSGKSVLVVKGGGTMVMGPSITDIATVELDKSDTAYNFTANGIAGLTVDDRNDKTNDTIAAGAAGQTLEGGGKGMETFVGFGSGVTTYKDDAGRFNGDTIKNFSSADQIDVEGLKFDSKTSVSFKASSSTEGVLTISEGSKVEAKITLFGQLAAVTFSAQSDGAGGTLILDPPATTPTVVHHKQQH